MSKVGDFFDKCLNPLFLLLAPLFFLFFLGVTVKECTHKEEKQRIKVQLDSLRRAQEEEQARLTAELYEHRTVFYNRFRQYYSYFKSRDEFDDWLDYADIAAMDLLHYLYSLRRNEYKGEEGFEKMCDYLGWEPPTFEKDCENCGHTVISEP